VRVLAKFRQVHTSFWQDPRVLEEMTPEDKYFYLYLLTNPNTTQIGVYQITKKQMAFDLGYSVESVNSLLERFENVHKVVKYNPQTREIAILNWGKYNLNKAGKPVIDCIKKELAEVKDKKLLWEIMNKIPNEEVTNLFSRYVYDSYNDTYNDTSTTSGQEKEEEKEEEKEKEIYKEVVEVVNPFRFFEENGFGTLSPYISEKIGTWIDDLSEELVLEAMKIAVENGKRTWKYIEAILKDWANHNFKSVQEVHAAQLAYKEQRSKQQSFKNSSKSVRQELIPDWLHRQQEEEPINDPDFEEEKRKVEELLKQYKK
jgi:DnaD/phage-associated family protein